MGQTPKHIPVLLDAVLQHMKPQRGQTYMDATAGYGGHASKILNITKQYQGTTLIDQDDSATESLKKRFGSKVEIIKSDFLSASQQLLAHGRQFDMILVDLGVSSEHLDNASRGFSFQHDGPLDMRMNKEQEISAHDIVNHSSRKELIDFLRNYGGEYKAPKIVDAILLGRPIKTTKQLAEIISHAIANKKHSKIHPATKTFQAIRIAVNDELTQLEQALPVWHQLLLPGGRLGIITFHSLEDRIVKNYFRDQAADTYEADLRVVNKKPAIATENELVSNPRSRSAKLRVVVKIKTERSV